uniref:Uncharacterized protein LOC114328054 n=1 Tax=Diabrotica virgifera virgifera TaxID=50390 RepID=A0A6P7FHB3_DIAVI
MPCEKVYMYAYEMGPEIWHLSVVVFKKEYSFSDKGVRITEPDTPTKYICMGTTTKSKCRLYNFLQCNHNEWKKTDYNVLTKNCQHFTQVLLDFLGIEKRIPSKYTNLPETCCELLGPHYKDLPWLFLKSSGNLLDNP